MTPDGGFSYDIVKRWTKKFEILQHYDLMIIPINIPARNHWVLTVIDLKQKKTVTYDSFETDTLRPTHPEIHAHLLPWLTREQQVRGIPFDSQDWKDVRGQQTPQQGDEVHSINSRDGAGIERRPRHAAPKVSICTFVLVKKQVH
jgi:Ulp1 family protease